MYLERDSQQRPGRAGQGRTAAWPARAEQALGAPTSAAHCTCRTPLAARRASPARIARVRGGEGTGVIAVAGIGVARGVAAVRALILVVLKVMECKF